MPKSLARGDYSLLMAIESSSRPNSWYRVLVDRQTRVLSCDCPPFTFNQQQDNTGNRSCPHTRFVTQLTTTNALVSPPATSVSADSALAQSLIATTREQWPGLGGTWSLEQKTTHINNKPYSVVLLRLALGNGSGVATSSVAFAHSHGMERQRLLAGVTGWCGYAIAAEVARLGGFPMAGQPPEHYRVPRRSGRATRLMPQIEHVLPPLGLVDILRLGDETRLDDGLTPVIRAERTLCYFLGEELYTKLESQHFLDISSVQYGGEQRVYRLRRDPTHQRERRVRVFEHGRYIRDYCIVRSQDVPEADFYLTNFLSFLSDEISALSVVQSSNIFSPYSDGQERETLAARWIPRNTHSHLAAQH